MTKKRMLYSHINILVNVGKLLERIVSGSEG